jgi:hypothetical protein
VVAYFPSLLLTYAFLNGGTFTKACCSVSRRRLSKSNDLACFSPTDSEDERDVASVPSRGTSQDGPASQIGQVHGLRHGAILNGIWGENGQSPVVQSSGLERASGASERGEAENGRYEDEDDIHFADVESSPIKVMVWICM